MKVFCLVAWAVAIATCIGVNMLLNTRLLLHLAAFATAAQSASIDRPAEEGSSRVVDLGYAKYKGRSFGTGVDEFLGMRYARPPVGNLRFRAPKDPEHVKGVQDASKFGPICVGVSQAPNDALGEDCLFVNVFKPSGATKRSKLPVWVFIQGGGYASNSDANYNGSTVVRESGHGLVFVNFNYRVGALGFLASEHVRKGGDLNAGLLDQRKLLHWVREHIHKFGGDPNHVVIHGDSAGGGSVSYHLTAYEGKKDNKLFVGAIPENPFWPTQRSVADMEFQYEKLLAKTNCDSLDCLRSVNLVDFLIAAAKGPFPGAASDNPLPLWYWLPVVDGHLVRDHMYNLFESGRFIRVPLLVGDDTDEGTAFASNAATKDDMGTFLKNNYPRLDADELQAVDALYPLTDPLPKHNAYFPSLAAAYGDCTFTCAGNEMASSTARHFDPYRVWNYRYNVQDPNNIANGLGVPHVFEKTAIFGVGNAGAVPASYYTTNAGIIPVTMHYFISFVQTLDPNTRKFASAPSWGAWGPGNGVRLRLQTNDTEMEVILPELSEKCALWKKLGAIMEV